MKNHVAKLTLIITLMVSAVPIALAEPVRCADRAQGSDSARLCRS